MPQTASGITDVHLKQCATGKIEIPHIKLKVVFLFQRIAVDFTLANLPLGN
jgi:hypothetical protein